MSYLNVDEITGIHIEHTSKCNLLCPQCARVGSDGKKNPILPLNELTIEDYKSLLTPDFASHIDRVFWCGNYGDSIASNNFLECLEFVRHSGVKGLTVVTNGSAQKPEWWIKMAKILDRDTDKVEFSIDGLEDTNHLYRINSNWQKLKENVESFIGAGGNACWDYLIFDHNRHQLAEAKDLADEMGFKEINFKNTSRFINLNDFNQILELETKNYNIISSWENKNTDKYEQIIDKFGNFNAYVDQTSITCKYKTSKFVYIDFQMKLWPCCWVGAPTYFYNEDNIQSRQLKFLENKYGKEFNSLRTNTLEEVLKKDFYATDLVSSWNNNIEDKNPKLFTCGRTCGDNFEFSSRGRGLNE
jgi:MoaA/NifB/PqqE/SkfB family radical SAM enzyme